MTENTPPQSGREDAPALFPLRISNTAKAAVEKAWPHLPPQIAEAAGFFMTLLEDVDNRYSPISLPADDYATATRIAKADPRFSDLRWVSNTYQRWREEREPIERNITHLTAYYMPPVIVTPPQ